jgi:hypothetical protein
MYEGLEDTLLSLATDDASPSSSMPSTTNTLLDRRYPAAVGATDEDRDGDGAMRSACSSLCFGAGKGMAKKSAMFLLPASHVTSDSPLWTRSRIQW